MTKDEKIQEVLGMLDLSEEDQYNWFEDNFELEGFNSGLGFVSTESMYDAAFRLRDEIVHEDSDGWADSCWYVTCWDMFNIIREPPKTIQARVTAEHAVLSQGPIYWLVAIYIAKKVLNG